MKLILANQTPLFLNLDSSKEFGFPTPRSANQTEPKQERQTNLRILSYVGKAKKDCYCKGMRKRLHFF